MTLTSLEHQVTVSASTQRTSAFGNVYQFAGRRFDDQAGLYYNRHRYYEPRSGRFVGRDPLEYVDGLNLYTYASNNPVNGTDPMGEKDCCCCCVDDLDIPGGGPIKNQTRSLPIPDKEKQTIKGYRQFANLYGTVFSIVMDLSYTKGGQQKEADCTLEWWEKSNLQVPGGKPGQWQDVYSKYHYIPMFKKWKERKKPCSGSENLDIIDVATVQSGNRHLPEKATQRTLYFAIRVSSAPDCPCKNKSIEVFATQVIQLKNKVVQGTPTFKTGGVPDAPPW